MKWHKILTEIQQNPQDYELDELSEMAFDVEEQIAMILEEIYDIVFTHKHSDARKISDIEKFFIELRSD